MTAVVLYEAIRFNGLSYLHLNTRSLRHVLSLLLLQQMIRTTDSWRLRIFKVVHVLGHCTLLLLSLMLGLAFGPLIMLTWLLRRADRGSKLTIYSEHLLNSRVLLQQIEIEYLRRY